MVETTGLAPLIEAADSMMKSANVKLAGYRKTGNGIVTVLVRGSVADCSMAVGAAVSSASKVGMVLRCHVIPFPWDELNDKLLIKE